LQAQIDVQNEQIWHPLKLANHDLEGDRGGSSDWQKELEAEVWHSADPDSEEQGGDC